MAKKKSEPGVFTYLVLVAVVIWFVVASINQRLKNQDEDSNNTNQSQTTSEKIKTHTEICMEKYSGYFDFKTVLDKNEQLISSGSEWILGMIGSPDGLTAFAGTFSSDCSLLGLLNSQWMFYISSDPLDFYKYDKILGMFAMQIDDHKHFLWGYSKVLSNKMTQFQIDSGLYNEILVGNELIFFYNNAYDELIQKKYSLKGSSKTIKLRTDIDN